MSPNRDLEFRQSAESPREDQLAQGVRGIHARKKVGAQHVMSKLRRGRQRGLGFSA